MHIKWLSAAVILSVLISSLNSVFITTKAAPAAADWQVTGQAGGPTQGLAVQGNYAYIGVGPRLVVVDISDPANPHQVGESSVMEDFVLGVAVSGTYAYVAAGGAGLQVVDIANPLTLSVIGTWHSNGTARGVAVSNGIAYLADGPYGLRVIDVTNPAAPLEIAHAFEMNTARGVVLDGRYAYIAAAGAGLLVADISNPAYPVELGACDTPGYANAAAVSGGLIYLADQWGGLRVINAADPLHPATIGTLQTQGWAFDVTLAGNKAYIADTFKGLRVVNISDPAHPIDIGGLEWAQSDVVNLKVVGSQAYLADRKNGLRVVNIVDPAHPLQTSLLDQFYFARMVDTGGGYAYVAAGFNGVRILNISDPAHPFEVGAYEFNSIAFMVKVVGTRLFACTQGGLAEQGIHVVDISDPTHPRRISYYDWVGECRGIGVVGNLGYFADAGGLKIVDFSDLANPQLVGNTQEWAGSAVIQGSLAYVVQGNHGWKIYNISNPANITTIGVLHDPTSRTQDIKVVGSLAYVLDDSGVRIYDVSNPANPVQKSIYYSSGMSWRLEVAGDRVYIAKNESGFEVLNVSDPLNPVLISKVDTLGSVQNIAASGGLLYVADMSGGMEVFSPPIGSLAALQPSAALASPAALIDRFLPGLAERERSPLLPPPAPARQFMALDRPAGTCVVTTTADSGPGSYRACLENQVNGDVITFSTVIFPPSNPAAIHVLTNLPFLDKGNVTIDASNAGVILDGSNVPSDVCCGVVIHSNGNVVRGLQVLHFPSMGIHLYGEYNLIGGSRLVGVGPVGQGNVFSDNKYCGIAFGKGNNVVKGNIVGLDASGTQALGSQERGMWVGMENSLIGGLAPGEGNIISANSVFGIETYGDPTSGNKILGNYVGTDITGTKSLGNGQGGIIVWFGSSNTLVQGNLVSGTGPGDGAIVVWDLASDFNTIIGNKVGTDVTGTQPIPNAGGIGVGYGTNNRVGGSEPGEGNLIYAETGVMVEGWVTGNNFILGNQVGLNIPGASNPGYGVGITLSGAQRTIVGGATPAEGNELYIDQNVGIATGSDYNTILGNRVGITADGTPPLRQGDPGLWIGGSHNLVQANQVAFSGQRGVWLDGPVGNTLRRNSIYSNPFLGILLVDGGNGGLPAPTISLNASGGSGTTCPGCTVELFLDAGNQGRFYLDSATADGSGSFSFPVYCPLPYPNLTTTATNARGDTSEFSSSRVVPWNCTDPNPLPTLVSVNPTSVNELGPTTLLTLVGSGFFSGSVVQFNGSALKTRYVDSTHLQAVLPLGQIGITGNTSITVLNPPSGGGTSNALNFTIVPNNPLPTLATLSPSSAIGGGAAFTLTVSGSGFINGSVVRWNGTDRTTAYVSATQLTASISAADIATPGIYPVRVFNPAPGGGTSNAVNFTVIAPNPLPTLAILSPSSAIAGRAAFTLTVTGTNFINGSVVKWNGSARTTTFVSATQLRASISAADIAAQGTIPVRVFNPTPGGGTSDPLTFTILAPQKFFLYLPLVR